MKLATYQSIALAMAATLALAGCGTGYHAARPGFDPGGSIMAYAHAVTTLDRHGMEKRIAGDCYSACTMFLSAKRVCVVPGAVLHFHGGSAADRSYSVFWTNQMRVRVPRAVDAYVDARGGWSSLRYVSVTANELYALGVRRCG